MAPRSIKALAVLLPCLLVIAASGTVAVSTMALRGLEGFTHPLQRAPADAQVLVVPAGALSRVQLAAELHRATQLPILLSGAVRPSVRGDSSSMRTLFETQYGVTPRWLELRAKSTEENAAYSSCLLQGEGIRDIVLITDATHMLRARLWHQYYGLQVLDAPSSFLDDRPSTPRDFLPSLVGYSQTRRFVHEVGGLADYLLKRLAGVRVACERGPDSPRGMPAVHAGF